MLSDDRTVQQDVDAEATADWLLAAGLAGPAYLLFQGLRPVSFLVGQGLLFLYPLLPMDRWRRTAGRFSQLFSDRSQLDRVLFSLESRLRDHENTPNKENA
jgi:hypothetical protein